MFLSFTFILWFSNLEMLCDLPPLLHSEQTTRSDSPLTSEFWPCVQIEQTLESTGAASWNQIHVWFVMTQCSVFFHQKSNHLKTPLMHLMGKVDKLVYCLCSHFTSLIEECINCLIIISFHSSTYFCLWLIYVHFYMCVILT